MVTTLLVHHAQFSRAIRRTTSSNTCSQLIGSALFNQLFDIAFLFTALNSWEVNSVFCVLA